MRVSKPFSFPYILKYKSVENCRFVTKQVGTLMIEGTVTLNTNYSIFEPERFDVDIDFIKWEGQDIRPVLELSNLWDQIQMAAESHARSIIFQTINQN